MRLSIMNLEEYYAECHEFDIIFVGLKFRAQQYMFTELDRMTFFGFFYEYYIILTKQIKSISD